jgi:hypothetical protein
MAFLVLCIGLWALIAFKIPVDTYGWLMLVSTGWFLGFVDAQFFRAWDLKHRRLLNADTLNEPDGPLFKE